MRIYGLVWSQRFARQSDPLPLRWDELLLVDWQQVQPIKISHQQQDTNSKNNYCSDIMGCGSSSPKADMPPGNPEDNPVVYFDITIGGTPAGRIEMTLRADVVPKTAEVRLVTGNLVKQQDYHIANGIWLWACI